MHHKQDSVLQDVRTQACFAAKQHMCSSMCMYTQHCHGPCCDKEEALVRLRMFMCRSEHCHRNCCMVCCFTLWVDTTYKQNKPTSSSCCSAQQCAENQPSWSCGLLSVPGLFDLQVVMTYWTPAQPPDWSSLAATLGQLWHKPKWSKSIYVDDHLLSGAPKGRSLHSHLQQLSAKACTVCDRQAQRPFSSNAALEKHVREQHKQHLCHVCLEVSLSPAAQAPLCILVLYVLCILIAQDSEWSKPGVLVTCLGGRAGARFCKANTHPGVVNIHTDTL